MTGGQMPFFASQGCQALSGPDLLAVSVDEADRARSRLWVSMFLVGLSAADDQRLSVRFLLDTVVRAHGRKVDVRIIVDDFRFGPEALHLNAPAAGYLSDRGVPVRVWEGAPGRASHSKLLISDATVVCGSGNWTPGGLDRNAELAVRVQSADLANDLARRFNAGWDESVPWSSKEPLIGGASARVRKA